jgi:protein MAK11
MDSVPKCRIMGSIRTKVHQFFYVALDKEGDATLLAVATEDGRILFFSTKESDLTQPESEDKKLPTAKLMGQIGGKAGGVEGRIKDFVVVPSAEDASTLYVAGGSSDGRVRVWRVGVPELQGSVKAEEAKGELLGMYETQNRITCMTAFMMIPRPEGAEESEDELEDEEEEESDSDEE